MKAYLVFVDPPDAIVGGDGTHCLWQLLRLRHHKVVKDGDDLALTAEGTGNLLVDPVLLLVISFASVKRIGRADENEVFALLNALQQVVVKLARLQALHVEEHCVVFQLQMDFQQRCQLGAV